VRVARPVEGFSISRGKLVIEITARFQVEDNVKLEGDAGYPQYQSLDVLTEPTARVSDISETVIQAAEYEDNGFGPVESERSATTSTMARASPSSSGRGGGLAQAGLGACP
jgi:hypothetical protein